MKVFFTSSFTLLHIYWLNYSYLSVQFCNRAKWYKLLSQKNLRSSFGLYLIRAKDLYIYIYWSYCHWHQKRAYTYHHQKYMLQFQPTSKVHRLESQRDNIATYAFSLCPFDQLSSKDITSKPLLGIFIFVLDFSLKNIMSYIHWSAVAHCVICNKICFYANILCIYILVLYCWQHNVRNIMKNAL
jgi:hypothetical protein